MRFNVAIAILGLSLFSPSLLRADQIYTYSSTTTLPPGLVGGISWSFDVPLLLTSTTTTANIFIFLSESTSGALSGCSISNVTLVKPGAASPSIITDFFHGCLQEGDLSLGGIINSDFAAPLTDGTYSEFIDANNNFTLTITDTTSTPEPSTLLLLGTSLLAVMGMRLTRRKSLPLSPVD